MTGFMTGLKCVKIRLLVNNINIVSFFVMAIMTGMTAKTVKLPHGKGIFTLGYFTKSAVNPSYPS
jgi:hypothetical protein